MKKSQTPLLIALGAVLGLLILLNELGRKAPVESLTPPLTLREYSNPYFGFALKLPEGWSLTESMAAQRQNLMVTVEIEHPATHAALTLRATETPWEYLESLALGGSEPPARIAIGDRPGRRSSIGRRGISYVTLHVEDVLFEILGPGGAIDTVITAFQWLPEEQKSKAALTFFRATTPSGRVQQWLEDCQALDFSAFGSVLHESGKTYVYVGSGQRPTGGYRCTISRILRTGTIGITVLTEFVRPSLGSDVTQAYSFPYDLVQINEQELSARFFGDGSDAPPVISVLADDDVLRPIYDQSRTIKVYLPAADMDVVNAVAFSGIVHGTVGRLFYRLLDSQEEVLDENSRSVEKSPHWHSFGDTLTIPDPATSGDTVHLEFYSIDDASGDIIDQVRIPLQVNHSE